jgi:molybdenum cofactor cytidylyltransferase
MVGIGAVVLAAGGSSRFGQAKQLVELFGETLVQRVVRAAHDGGCGPVIVVTGESHELVTAAVAGFDPLIVRNEHWARGIGSSIRLGVERLTHHAVDAIVVLACDQPAVDSGVVSALIEEHARSGCPVVASHYADTLGIPALFHQSLFDELLRLPDEHGAKVLIQKDPSRAAHIDFANGAFDVDTPEDLLNVSRRFKRPIA